MDAAPAVPARRARRPRSLRAARAQALEVDRRLTLAWPDAHCELDFRSPLELLVATVLSAQTTDKRVNAVTPVLAWWPDPSPVRVVDRREVERVVRVPVADLLDPAHRFTAVFGPYRGPAFEVGDLFVWGFTAMLLSTVLDLSGLARPWDERRERELPERVRSPWMRALEEEEWP